MRLEGNVSIITGAGQGIGEAYALRFAREGARVAVVDVNREKGEAVAEAIRKQGGEAVFVAADVSSEEETKAMAATVAETWGRIDTLINNAAIFYGIENFNYSFEYLKKIFSVNYFGTWLCSRAVFPYMKKQQKGSVINQSSGAAYLHMQAPIDEELPSFHYSVTKAAVGAFTHFMAGSVGVFGIRVNAISPGPTMTEATKQGVPEDIMNWIVSMMMAVKRPLQPEDIPGTAVWLASDDSAMVTGQVICVDGGMVMLG
jgi:3-oxoacyl-[acyl-carrier protein] reductase